MRAFQRAIKHAIILGVGEVMTKNVSWWGGFDSRSPQPASRGFPLAAAAWNRG
jgi:hypothetical protein